MVFGVAGERDPRRRDGMGVAAAEFADFAVLTSENPRSEDPAAIVRDIAAAMERAGKSAPADFEEQPDRRAAIARGFALASAGRLRAHRREGRRAVVDLRRPRRAVG